MVSTIESLHGETKVQSSDSLSEVYSKWEISAGVDVKTAFFSGGMEAEFSSVKKQNMCNRFFLKASPISNPKCIRYLRLKPTTDPLWSIS